MTDRRAEFMPKEKEKGRREPRPAAKKKAGAVQSELASFDFGTYVPSDPASSKKLPRRQESCFVRRINGADAQEKDGSILHGCYRDRDSAHVVRHPAFRITGLRVILASAGRTRDAFQFKRMVVKPMHNETITVLPHSAFDVAEKYFRVANRKRDRDVGYEHDVRGLTPRHAAAGNKARPREPLFRRRHCFRECA